MLLNKEIRLWTGKSLNSVYDKMLSMLAINISERNGVLTMQSNLRVKIGLHYLKCGATKLICTATYTVANLSIFTVCLRPTLLLLTCNTRAIFILQHQL